jgi:hypothetical protein
MPSTTPKQRSETILRERIQGDTLSALAKRHRMSIEGVRGVLIREGGQQIDDFERRLRANVGTDQVEAFLIPWHSSEDVLAAVAYLKWALAQLADRGIETRISYQVTDAGAAFGVAIAEEA